MFSVQPKKSQAYKETGKYCPFKGKKINQQKLSLIKISLVADVLAKYFKATVLKMLRELKEDMEKVKKIMYEQNANINKETGNLRNQKENQELKSTVIKMKNVLEGFKGRFECAKNWQT